MNGGQTCFCLPTSNNKKVPRHSQGAFFYFQSLNKSVSKIFVQDQKHKLLYFCVLLLCGLVWILSSKINLKSGKVGTHRYRPRHKPLWDKPIWETELGYAIAQHDPANAGIEMLKHPLANVRQGAWFGIAKIGVPTVEILQKINQQRDRSTQPHFRHAAFRAIDKSLITIEVYGTQQDVQALKNWLPEVSDFAVKDRIAFTLAELDYRLEQAKGSGDWFDRTLIVLIVMIYADWYSVSRLNKVHLCQVGMQRVHSQKTLSICTDAK